MQDLDNYETGGVIHIIANNQVGFTTSPKEGRSTPFCTEIGKAYEMPIIHVNADDPVAVDFAFKAALDFRNKFQKDVIVDLIGYRKNGHNELDQPFFTQPLQYEIISKHPNVMNVYEKRLINEGIEKVKCNLNKGNAR
jgi:2-oxoglutarate dehydrogenase E1 component